MLQDNALQVTGVDGKTLGKKTPSVLVRKQAVR